MLLRQAGLVRQFSLARKWLLGPVGVAVIAVAGTVSAVAVAASAPRLGARAPTPRLHSVPPSVQTHYVPRPYISATLAERTALAVASEMGPGARVLQARLMSVAAASKATGDRVASYYTGDSRKVWLVWLRGPFRVVSCITATACPVKLNQVFYAAIDARTGFDYGVGWNRAYERGVNR
jgi:hypothetical protein